ncbi:hypothetical protein [Leptospirillum ferriphilum]|jgi:hypothetical protein|nr:hypothetical protein [Leptospirillum ferriphilum]
MMSSNIRFRVLDPYNDDISYTFDTKDEAKLYIEKSYPALRKNLAYVFRMEEVQAQQIFTLKSVQDILKALKSSGYYIEPVHNGKIEDCLNEGDIEEFRAFFSGRFRFFREK